MKNYSGYTYAQIQSDIDAQRKSHTQFLPLRGIAQVGTSIHKLSMGDYGALHVMSITGKYETTLLTDGGETILDTGRCYLSAKISDGSRNRNFFDDYISLDLFLTPGRAKFQNDASVFPTQLFQQFELDYIFDVNSDLIVEMQNISNRPQQFELMFASRRIYK